MGIGWGKHNLARGDGPLRHRYRNECLCISYPIADGSWSGEYEVEREETREVGMRNMARGGLSPKGHKESWGLICQCEVIR